MPHIRMVNYIAVPQRASWGDRRIGDLELIFMVKGRFEYFTTDGEHVDLRPNDILLIKPTEEGTFRHTGVGSPVISCIHCELTGAGRWAAGDYRLSPEPRRVTRPQLPADFRRLFKRAAEAFEGCSRNRLAITRTIVCEIWLRLAEYWTGGGNSETVSERVQEMISFLRKKLATPVGRRDLAEKFAITPEHVNYIFRRELGVTPTEFIHRERCLWAYRLLKENKLSIKEAAETVGFADQFHFSRVFKRTLGAPPSRV
jgi:AraC-like DNA-binding protein